MHYNFEVMNDRGGKAFLDTGTTFMYVSQALFNAIVSAFNSHCLRGQDRCGAAVGYQECYHVNPLKYPKMNEFVSTFPIFDFKFAGGETIKWYPQDYFVASGSSKSYQCIGIKVLKDMILGALFMRNYDISFEKNGKKITFVRANCGKTNDFVPYDGPKKEGMAVAQTVAPAVKVGEQDVQKVIIDEMQKPKNALLSPSKPEPKFAVQPEPQVIEKLTKRVKMHNNRTVNTTDNTKRVISLWLGILAILVIIRFIL